MLVTGFRIDFFVPKSMDQIQKFTVNKAIFIGIIGVNGPIFPLMFGIPILILFLTPILELPPFFNRISIPAGFIIAWLWWSISVPKWRLWALRHVDDISQLYKKAVKTGIFWRRGSFFERTEIRSNTHVIQERKLELIYFLTAMKEELHSWFPETNKAANELVDCFAQSNEIDVQLEAAEKLRQFFPVNHDFPSSAQEQIAEFFNVTLMQFIQAGNKVK